MNPTNEKKDKYMPIDVLDALNFLSMYKKNSEDIPLETKFVPIIGY